MGSNFFPYNSTCKLTWQFSMHSHSISFDIKDLSHPINHIWFHLNFSSRTFACLIKSGIWYYSDKTHINRVFILRVKQSAKHLYQICIANTPVWFSLTKCVLLRRPVNSPLKGPVTRKMFIFDDVTMLDYILRMRRNSRVTERTHSTNMN